MPGVKRLLGFVLVLVLLAAGAAGFAAFTLQRSLPPPSETVPPAIAEWPADAGAAITIELDSLGIPSVRGASENAIAYGQGYAHARDRRFQMELLRRTAAGRLAELVGAAALPSDRFFRKLGLAPVADAGIALLGPRRRALFEAYAAGVNAFDRAHPSPPEFLVLGAPAEPWRPRDTALVALLMQQDQAWGSAEEERDRELMDATLPPALVDFLLPQTTPLDVVLLEGPMPAPPRLPTPAEFDTRTARTGRRGGVETGGVREARGSNSWAVAGAWTASGRPLLANDPHMTLRVPLIWHRQRLVFPDAAVTGVTLPGVPGVVCGTNGAVAWGLTNPNVDAVDLVRCLPADAETTAYAGPAGLEPFRVRREILAVKGAPAETLDVRTTRFGPVVWASAAAGGGLLAAQWTALDPVTVDTDLFALGRAPSLAAFLVALDGYRGPQMNVIAADSAGHIGWKVGGLLPRRTGGPSDRPRDARDPGAGWSGYLAGADVPSRVDPPSGVLAIANQRVAGGRAWEVMGGRVAAPWRARRIAAVLAAADSGGLDVAAMSALQNDLDAAFLEPTALALAAALDRGRATPAADDTLARVRAIVARWDRRADTTSVAHAYLVQARSALHELLLEPLVAPCVAADSDFVYDDALVDEVARRLLAERPSHLLAPRFDDYDALVRAAARRAAARLGARVPGVPFDKIAWGRINRSDLAHPLGAVSPALARVLDLPKVALGGSNVVRVTRPRYGATMRMVVDLGDRDRSAFAMPGGQSGHFRSPHYGDQFADWWAGRAGRLEPGPPVGRIVLRPRPAPPGPG
jgi:penicillin amidase